MARIDLAVVPATDRALGRGRMMQHNPQGNARAECVDAGIARGRSQFPGRGNLDTSDCRVNCRYQLASMTILLASGASAISPRRRVSRPERRRQIGTRPRRCRRRSRTRQPWSSAIWRRELLIITSWPCVMAKLAKARAMNPAPIILIRMHALLLPLPAAVFSLTAGS